MIPVCLRNRGNGKGQRSTCRALGPRKFKFVSLRLSKSGLKKRSSFIAEDRNQSMWTFENSITVGLCPQFRGFSGSDSIILYIQFATFAGCVYFLESKFGNKHRVLELV